MITPDKYLDGFAIQKYHKPGKCKNTCFADGGHRVGLVPVLSLLDGALPGDTAQEICIECEKVFERKVFYPIGQPSVLGFRKC